MFHHYHGDLNADQRFALTLNQVDNLGPVWDKVEEVRMYRANMYLGAVRPGLFTHTRDGAFVKVESIDNSPEM